MLRLRFGEPRHDNTAMLAQVGLQDWRMEFYKQYGYIDEKPEVTKKFATLCHEYTIDNRYWVLFESELAEYLYNNNIEL